MSAASFVSTAINPIEQARRRVAAHPTSTRRVRRTLRPHGGRCVSAERARAPAWLDPDGLGRSPRHRHRKNHRSMSAACSASLLTGLGRGLENWPHPVEIEGITPELRRGLGDEPTSPLRICEPRSPRRRGLPGSLAGSLTSCTALHSRSKHVGPTTAAPSCAVHDREHAAPWLLRQRQARC